MDTGSLASLLSGLFTAGAGISQLGSQNSAQSAALADPFAAQYGNYQGQVQTGINSIQAQQGAAAGTLGGITSQLQGMATGGNPTISGAIGAIGGLNTNAGSVPASVSGSAGSLASQISNLQGNYLNDPVIQSELATGTANVNRGLAATGMMGSGNQQIELQQYGQQFAQQQYQTQLGNILSENQQEFGQNVGSTQLGAALEGQTFSQGLQQQGAIGGLAGQLSQLQTGQLTAAGQVGGTNANLQLNSGQGLLNSLEALSGATTGSPSTAGIINSQQFGQQQQGIANLGSGANGILSGLGSLLSGIGGVGGLGSDLGSILSGLGSGGNGLLDAFTGGGGFSNVFGSGTSDLAGMIGDTAGGTGILGDTGVLLGGLF